MSREYVKIKNGKFFIPRNISKPRGNTANTSKSVVGCAFIIFAILFVNQPGIVNKLIFIGFHAICLLLGLIALEFVRRWCLLAEEYHHLHTRYGGSVSNLLKYVFEFDNRVLFVFLGGLLVLFLLPMEQGFEPLRVEGYEPLALIAVLFGILMLKGKLNLTASKLYDSMRIKDMNGLDYGSAMAHSNFHGYLKIMLPPDGYTSNNLKDLMIKYESDNNIQFQMYKLYILVPLSCHCTTSLKTDSSLSILESKTLESIRRDRAGVKMREYKNSVYKIKYSDTKDPIYVSAEYATPLLTFKEVINQDSMYSHIYREHKNEIIWNFYNTTKLLLEQDPDCRGLCEPILYDDTVEKGGYIDVGQLLFKKIMKERMALKRWREETKMKAFD